MAFSEHNALIMNGLGVGESGISEPSVGEEIITGYEMKPRSGNI